MRLGKYNYYFKDAETPFNNSSSTSVIRNKYRANKLLQGAGIPVPESVSLTRTEFQNNETLEKIAHLKFPLVIKPIFDSARGKDVLCNIKTIEQLQEFLASLFLTYENVMIEEFHGQLNSYRVLVFNKKVIGVVQRYASRVVGDGVHTIKQLIQISNIERKASYDFLRPIEIDDECRIKLEELGITENYIPEANETVVLSYTSNASRGGTYQSLGTQISSGHRKLMIKIAALLNLNLAGIDIECADINKPLNQSKLVVIEVNCRPSIQIHELPIDGQPHIVTKKIMRSFIFRHPFAYLYSLYSNPPTALYCRASLLLVLAGILYLIL